MKNIKQVSNMQCPNCGAPVTTEICQYCHAATGLDTRTAYMEYPVIDCKEAILNFWTVIFPSIFAVFFISPIFFIAFFTNDIRVLLLSSYFFIFGIIALSVAIIPLIRYYLIKKNGKEIQATVYGYMDDNILLNGSPAQIVKLLVNTNDGPRFILYQLGTTHHPYTINSIIRLKVYKNYFRIIKDTNDYFRV